MASPNVLTAKQQEWIAHLEKAQRQGLSLQEYARRTDIKASSLYAARKWLRKIRPPAASQPVNFTEVCVAGMGQDAACILHLAPGIRLQLTALPSPQWLAVVCAQWSQRS